MGWARRDYGKGLGLAKTSPLLGPCGPSDGRVECVMTRCDGPGWAADGSVMGRRWMGPAATPQPFTPSQPPGITSGRWKGERVVAGFSSAPGLAGVKTGGAGYITGGGASLTEGLLMYRARGGSPV